MNKYIVTLQVIIEGNEVLMGTIGSLSGTTDYHPNTVKNTVTDYYKLLYPTQRIAVKI